MRRTIILFSAGILMVALAAGAALAVLRVGNDNPNTLYGTTGDNKGQDTLFGPGAGDKLIGRSVADQLAGGPGNDRLEGNDGNDTLDAGRGRDLILTGRGFDFVYAEDGYRDTINCNGQSDYRIVFSTGSTTSTGTPGRTPTPRARPLMLWEPRGQRTKQWRYGTSSSG